VLNIGATIKLFLGGNSLNWIWGGACA